MMCEMSTAGALSLHWNSVLSSSTRIAQRCHVAGPHGLGLRQNRTCSSPHLTVRAGSGVDGADTRVAEAPSSKGPSVLAASEDVQRPGAEQERDADSDEVVSSLMEGVTFSQLCDDFECVSSPAVERTARLLARDIRDIREDKRSLSCFAIDVKYKDPLRSFKGREGYRRQSWILNGLEEPRVIMVGMEMLSTSVLVIRWRLRGSFRMMPAASLMGAKLDLLITSTFTLNQISGQVVNHEDAWDLSASPPQAAVLFYASRLAWSTVQASKDLSDAASKAGSLLDRAQGSDNSFVYPDPSGDPRKFFMQDDPNRDLYQFAFAVALLWFLVQFLQAVI